MTTEIKQALTAKLTAWLPAGVRFAHVLTTVEGAPTIAEIHDLLRKENVTLPVLDTAAFIAAETPPASPFILVSEVTGTREGLEFSFNQCKFVDDELPETLWFVSTVSTHYNGVDALTIRDKLGQTALYNSLYGFIVNKAIPTLLPKPEAPLQ